MKSVINKVVLGIIWLIIHIIFLVLLIIFTIHQIMTEQYPEQITFLLIYDCVCTILTVVPVIYLRDWLNELHGKKDLQTKVDSLEITNIALQAGYDDAEKDRLYWVDKYKEAEHRAEVAEHELERRLAEATKAMYVYERALYYATLNGETADEVKYNDALKRAQKDFAENKGD